MPPRGRGNYALNFRLTADARELRRRLGTARRDLQKFATDARASILAASRVTAGVTAGLAASVGLIARASRQAARDSRRFSTVAGVSARDFRGFGFAIQQFGGEMRDAQEVLADFQTRLVELQRGESTAVQAFGAIGAAATDFIGQDAVSAFQTFLQAARSSTSDLIAQQTAIDDLFGGDREFVLQMIRRADTFETLQQRVRDVTGEVRNAEPIWRELDTTIGLLGVAVTTNFNNALVDSLSGVRSFDGLVRAAGQAIYGLTTALISGARYVYDYRDAISAVGYAVVIAFSAGPVVRSVSASVGAIALLVRSAVTAATVMASVALYGFILNPAGLAIAALASVGVAIFHFHDSILHVLRPLQDFGAWLRDTFGKIADDVVSSVRSLGLEIAEGVQAFVDWVAQTRVASSVVSALRTAIEGAVGVVYEYREAFIVLAAAVAGAFVASGVLNTIGLILSGLGTLVRGVTSAALILHGVQLFAFILNPAGQVILALAAITAAAYVFSDEIVAIFEDLDEILFGFAEDLGGLFPGPGAVGAGIFGSAFAELEASLKEAGVDFGDSVETNLTGAVEGAVESAQKAIELPELVVVADPNAQTGLENLTTRISDRMSDILDDFKGFLGRFADFNAFAGDLLGKAGLPSLGDLDFGEGQARQLQEELSQLRRDLQSFDPRTLTGGLSSGPGVVRDRPSVFEVKVPVRHQIFEDLGDDMLQGFQFGFRRALQAEGNIFENLGRLVVDTLVEGLQQSATRELATALKPAFDAFGTLISGFLASLIGFAPGPGNVAGVTHSSLAGSRSPVGFQEGGFIPGPRGAPQVVIAHGGELVLNQRQQDALLGGVQVSLTQQIYGDPTASQRRALLRDASLITDIVQSRLQERRILR